jgi:hypothetical protein
MPAAWPAPAVRRRRRQRLPTRSRRRAGPRRRRDGLRRRLRRRERDRPSTVAAIDGIVTGAVDSSSTVDSSAHRPSAPAPPGSTSPAPVRRPWRAVLRRSAGSQGHRRRTGRGLGVEDVLPRTPRARRPCSWPWWRWPRTGGAALSAEWERSWRDLPPGGGDGEVRPEGVAVGGRDGGRVDVRRRLVARRLPPGRSRRVRPAGRSSRARTR